MTGAPDLRRLRRADLPLLDRWLREPLVHRWWHHETGPDALERDFGPAIDGTDPTDLFLACWEGTPFGLIQRYRIDSYPEYVEELSAICTLPPGALSIDYLIGEPGYRGRGLGALMIAELCARSWSDEPGASAVLVPVAAGNEASWRSLEAAGFVRIAEGPLTPDNPVDPPDSVVYLLQRPVESGSS